MTRHKQKIAVGLSGGVDSSVAAALLKEDGYEVVGLTMKIFDDSVDIKESERHACYGPGEIKDVENAAAVCDELGIPFLVIDLKDEFRSQVIEYVRREYLAGRTPNPCVRCNQLLKFGFMLDKARVAGFEFDFFATGHYARIEKTGEGYLLKRAADLSKDQSYFLYTLTQEQLSRTLFPLGSLTKDKVREKARAIGLETSENPESQDFIAGGDYSVLFEDVEAIPGDIIDTQGNILGRHKGIIHYTIGQRRGLGISSRRPLYVVEIDAVSNRIIVSDKEDLLSKGLVATDLNFIAIEKLDQPHSVKAKIRFRHKEADATLSPFKTGDAEITFDEPQTSITPGQAVVFYQNDVVLGGGTIARTI